MFGGRDMNKIKQLLEHELIEPLNIPNIPLYMDQVTGYLDEVFKDVKRNDEEKILTKTMINNYVKAGILKNPEKKKYSHEQLMSLMMIYLLKNVTSMTEIDHILKEQVNVLDLYNRFREIDENVKTKITKEVKDHQNKDQLDQILYLLQSANLQKRLAEVLLDELIQKKSELKNT